ncbi:hypothetical protein MKW92_052045, partial [Papaver armeniacum]
DFLLPVHLLWRMGVKEVSLLLHLVCSMLAPRGPEQEGFSPPSASFVENGSQRSSLLDDVARLLRLHKGGTMGKKHLHLCRDDSMSSSSTTPLLSLKHY